MNSQTIRILKSFSDYKQWSFPGLLRTFAPLVLVLLAGSGCTALSIDAHFVSTGNRYYKHNGEITVIYNDQYQWVKNSLEQQGYTMLGHSTIEKNFVPSWGVKSFAKRVKAEIAVVSVIGGHTESFILPSYEQSSSYGSAYVDGEYIRGRIDTSTWSTKESHIHIKHHLIMFFARRAF